MCQASVAYDFAISKFSDDQKCLGKKVNYPFEVYYNQCKQVKKTRNSN